MKKWLILALSTSAFALNQIHEAKFQFSPTPMPKKSLQLGGGGLWTTDGLRQIPVNLIGNFTPDLLGGLRLNFDSQNKDWNQKTTSTTLNLGLAAKLRNSAQLQVDVLIPIGSGSHSQGANISYTRFLGAKDLGMAAQAGVFFGFNSTELCEMEVGFYPWWRMMSAVDLLAELTFSTSPTSVADYAALDLAPGLRFHLNGGWKLLGLATMGVKGAHKENNTLWKTVIQHDF